MASPRAAIVLGVDDKRFLGQLRGAGSKFQTWAQRTSAGVSSALKSAFGGLSDIAGLAGTAGLAYLAKQTIEFERDVTRLGVSANKSRGQMLQFAGQMGKLAGETGVNRDEILAGAQAYVAATGDLDGFSGSMATLAKVQVATGANMTDLSKIAATLQQSLDIDPSQMMQVFDTLSVQAKAGSVELPDMAAEFQGLAVSFSKFGDKGPAAVAALGAWMQTLKRGAPTAAEASTQLQNLIGAVSGKGAAKLEGMGIKVYTNRKTGEMRSLNAIMDEFINKVDAADVSKIFNDKQVKDAIASYRKFHDTFVDLKDPAQSQGTIMKDFATNSETAAQRIARLQEKLKATFTDVISRHLDDIVMLVEKLVKALEWVAAHPEAMIAVAALFKGGGILSEIGGGMGGGIGAAAGGGAGGGAMSYIGGAMRGGALGYGIGKALGAEGIQSAATTITGALAGLPGPLGLFGKALAVAEAGILAVFQHLEAKIEEDRKAYTESKVAGGGTAIMDKLGILNKQEGFNSSTGQLEEVGAGKWREMSQRWRADKATPEERQQQADLLRNAKASGFIKTGKDGTIGIDHAALDEAMKNDMSLTPGQKARYQEALGLAMNTAYGSDEQAQNLRANLGDTTVRPRQYVQNLLHPGGLGPIAGDGSPMVGSEPVPGASQAELTAALKTLTEKLGSIGIKIEAAPGIKATVDSDPKIARGGPTQ